MKLKNKLNMTSLCEKYPNFKSDFDMNWRNIVKRCLTDQVHRNRDSERLTKVKERCKHVFGYLDDEELSVVQDRISDKFIQRIHESDWDPWRQTLSKIFNKKSGNVDLTDKNFTVESIIRCDENGVPTHVSSVPKEKTYTVIIRENGTEEGNSFVCKNVPIDVAMTTISQLSSALS